MSRDMTLGEIQGHLQQILHDDHPLNIEQRTALKKATAALDLLKRMDRGLQIVKERMTENGMDFPRAASGGDP